MDTSEIYIKMCETAEEIQELWQPTHGDYYWGNDSYNEPDNPEYLTDRRFYEVRLLADFDSEGGWFHLEPKHIDKARHTWLPRQDELQEMVRSGSGSPLWMIKTLECKIQRWYDQGDNSWVNCTSFEQLWLAFVMREKYNKVWGGKDWKLLSITY